MWPFQRNRSHRVRSSGPYWLSRNGMGDAAPALARSIECDIAVVGCGITGALITDSLVSTGQVVVMLDARDRALGSTAASTALLQYEIDTHLTDLARQIGAERATRAYRACAASFEMLERRFPELLPPADYRRRESLYLAADESAMPALRAELEARRRIGLACEWLEGDEPQRRFGCRRPGAILSALAAEIDPVRFTQALICGVERHGVRRFARSKVGSITEHGQGLRLAMESGHSVDAQHVIVAAGYESLDFLPRDVANIDNTYAVATQPLADTRRAATMPLSGRARVLICICAVRRTDGWCSVARMCHSRIPRRAMRCCLGRCAGWRPAIATCLERTCPPSTAPGAGVSPRPAMACRSLAVCLACTRACNSHSVMAATASPSACMPRT